MLIQLTWIPRYLRDRMKKKERNIEYQGSDVEMKKGRIIFE